MNPVRKAIALLGEADAQLAAFAGRLRDEGQIGRPDEIGALKASMAQASRELVVMLREPPADLVEHLAEIVQDNLPELDGASNLAWRHCTDRHKEQARAEVRAVLKALGRLA